MTAPLPSPRTGRAAVAAGALLFLAVAAELIRPVQTADGALTDVPGFVLYLAAWTIGAGCLVAAISGLGDAPPPAPDGSAGGPASPGRLC